MRPPGAANLLNFRSVLDMPDIVCLGEALIDLVPTQSGVALEEAQTFVKAAGGAPANVAAGLGRLGVASAFVGMVGDDGFGRFLAETLASNGVDISGLRITKAVPTALAAVSLRADGERDFAFYGRPASYSLLAPADLDEGLISRAKILHFGSLSLIDEPARSATLHAVELAHRHGLKVSYDPNLRLSLWADAEAARKGLRLGLSLADIVKISEDEIAFLCDACDTIEGARALWHPRLAFMAVTRGAKGCLWLDPRTEGAQLGFTVDAIDTTGAGDAFMAGLLAGLADDPNALRKLDGIGRMLRFANATGALATTTRGAIGTLPDRAAVERFLATVR